MNGLDTDVPRWFQDASSWYSSEARVQENSLFNLKVQSEVLNLQEKKQSIENTALTNQRLSKDLTDIPTWMRDHPTWQSRSDAPWPTALTPQGDRMLQEQRLRDSQSIQAETAVIATHDFATRVAKLRDLNPEAAGQFAPYISQRPSPQILQALSLAEEQARLHQRNLDEASKIEAEASGMNKKVAIGPKGEVTTYTTPKASEMDVEPRILDIGFGKRVIWKPGGKTMHIVTDEKGKKPIELTPEQMRNISKDLPDTDPRKQGILDFLAEIAKKQTEATSTSSAPNPAQSQPKQSDIDYLKAHPDKKAGFDSRFGAGAADKYLK